MPVAILSIGTELTRGELTNSNASWLAARLTDAGFDVTRIDTCDDDFTRIERSLRELALHHDAIVSTGGLGPTSDDMTSEAVARTLGVPVVRDEASLRELEEKFRKFGRVMAESNKKQADFPRGATVLPNPNGTAPGFAVVLPRGAGRCLAFFMPGVPREMMPMFEASVLPALTPLASNDTAQVKLMTYGRPESEVGELLAGVEAEFKGVTLGYRAHFPHIEVKVFGRGVATDGSTAQQNARALVARATQRVRERLGHIVFAEGDTSFPQAVAAALRARSFTLALAESCTGGLLSQLLCEQPSSDYFLGSMVTYANSAKELLGVDGAIIAAHGAVSAETATAMATCARDRFGASIGAAITGIAGPTGGSEQKPIGTVFISVVTETTSKTERYLFRGDRFRIQRHAAFQAMSLILRAANTTASGSATA